MEKTNVPLVISERHCNNMIRRLRMLQREHERDYGGSTEESVALSQAADTIRTLFKVMDENQKDLLRYCRLLAEERAKQRWTAVADQPPKRGEYVLVRYKNDDMAIACWFDRDEDTLFWRAMTDEGWCADCDAEPTHWMPRPAPPEEE